MDRTQNAQIQTMNKTKLAVIHSNLPTGIDASARLLVLSLATALLFDTFAVFASAADTPSSRILLPTAILDEQYAVPLPLKSAVGEVSCRTTAGNLPPGFVCVDGWLKGKPSEVGRYSFEVTATDEVGQSAIASFALTVCMPPAVPLEIPNNKLPDCTVCNPYYASLLCQGGYPPYKWAVERGNLPQGLVLKDGQIIGEVARVLAEPVTVNLTIEVQDDRKLKATRNMNLKLLPCQAIHLRIGRLGETADGHMQLPTAVVGQPYGVVLPVHGGHGLLKWNIQGKLPPGVALGDGTLSGTPTSSGRYSFVTTVSDSIEQRLTRSCELKVLPPSAEPATIITKRLPPAVLGEPYKACLQVAGGIHPYRWRIVDGSLPSWAVLEENLIQGTCTKVRELGQRSFSVMVDDGSGGTAGPVPLTLSISPNRRFPEPNIMAEELPLALLGQRYYAIIPIQGGLPPYRFELTESQLPKGLSMSPEGILRGNIAEAGNWQLQVRATDNLGQSSQTRTLELKSRKASDHELKLGRFGDLTASLNKVFEFQIPVSGGLLPYRFTLEGSLPRGLAWDSELGRLSGKPNQIYLDSLQVTVRDGSLEQAEDHHRFQLRVVSTGLPATRIWARMIGSAAFGILATGAVSVGLWRRSARNGSRRDNRPRVAGLERKNQ